jgi:hypothetical protein
MLRKERNDYAGKIPAGISTTSVDPLLGLSRKGIDETTVNE